MKEYTLVVCVGVTGPMPYLRPKRQSKGYTQCVRWPIRQAQFQIRLFCSNPPAADRLEGQLESMAAKLAGFDY